MERMTRMYAKTRSCGSARVLVAPISVAGAGANPWNLQHADFGTKTGTTRRPGEMSP